MTSQATIGDIQLATQRLLLREIESSDQASLYSYWSDLEFARYLPRGPLTEESVSDFVERVLSGRHSRPRRYFRFAITLKEDGRFVGDCVCRISDPENREDLSRIIGQAYIGYFLAKEFWGQGYATEVAKTLLSFGFQKLGLVRIWAWCDTENLASIRVLEKVGMKREGHFRRSVDHRGKWRDCFVHGILHDEWNET